MPAYYNEIDPYAGQWLRNLIDRGLITPGDVDERSIADVSPDDLAGYGQCHFFAGIGGWSYALRLAGWPDNEPVWTGSCPCQPFSSAGQRKGHADQRHLWPAFHRLIAECRPPICFGEQVASRDGREWLAGVRADLEVLGYAVGAADLCAASIGAPHIRQRLFWLADADEERRDGRAIVGTASRAERTSESEWQQSAGNVRIVEGCANVSRRLAFADGRIESHGDLQRSGQHGQQPQDDRIGGLGDAGRAGLEGWRVSERGGSGERTSWQTGGDANWLPCTDGKTRRVEPGTFPLAHGVPARVGRLRGYGNAIVPQVAAEFVSAFLECRP